MLENIKLPDDLKSLSINDLKILCDDVRKEIIEKVSVNGGHLSSNLGVVELTVMLHYVFNLPNDKLLFDVSHQCYTHKILSGRSLENLLISLFCEQIPNFTKKNYEQREEV